MTTCVVLASLLETTMAIVMGWNFALQFNELECLPLNGFGYERKTFGDPAFRIVEIEQLFAERESVLSGSYFWHFWSGKCSLRVVPVESAHSVNGNSFLESCLPSQHCAFVCLLLFLG